MSVFSRVPKMTGVLLSLLLAAPVLLVAGAPVNGTLPVVLWHGMGERFQQLNANTTLLLRAAHLTVQSMDLC